MLRFLKLGGAFLCVLGSVLSTYAFYVEISKELDKNYKALCDISEHMSCSAVFTSKYGKGFGFLGKLFGENSTLNQPNPVYGLIFYSLQMILGQFDSVKISKIQIYMAALANIGSVYLAYLLYFVLHDFCVVCVSTYIINALMWLCYIKRHQVLKKHSSQKQKTT